MGGKKVVGFQTGADKGAPFPVDRLHVAESPVSHQHAPEAMVNPFASGLSRQASEHACISVVPVSLVNFKLWWL